ncbi:MAG: hypothetical protein ABIV28_06130, partial [Longimicrobiales bacterium]
MNGITMNQTMLRLSLVAALTALPSAVHAQERTTTAQRPAAPPPVTTLAVGPPIQRIATASAVSTESIGTVTSVRELPDGRVLVNDGQRRRLVLMDTTLKTVRVVLDSLTDVANTYGTRPGALLPYQGDSTLFVDPASYAMLVIDPQGTVTRVRSVWRVQDLPWVSNTFNGWPGIDARGRIIFRIPAQIAPAFMMMAMTSKTPYMPPQPDSAFIVAIDLTTRKLDTLGSVRIPKQEARIRSTGDNGWTMDQVINPLPRTDEWAVLSDHRIAFVRGLDYRIDYLNPDGSWTSSPKIPYDWQRLQDEDKQKFVDSVRVLQEKQAATQFVGATIRWVNMYNGKYPENFKVPEGLVLQPGFPKDWFLPPGLKFPENYVYACAPGVTPTGSPGVTMNSTMTVVSEGGRTMMMMGGPPGGAMPGGAMPGGAPGAAGAPSCLPAPVVI